MKKLLQILAVSSIGIASIACALPAKTTTLATEVAYTNMMPNGHSLGLLFNGVKADNYKVTLQPMHNGAPVLGQTLQGDKFATVVDTGSVKVLNFYNAIEKKGDYRLTIVALRNNKVVGTVIQPLKVKPIADQDIKVSFKA